MSWIDKNVQRDRQRKINFTINTKLDLDCLLVLQMYITTAKILCLIINVSWEQTQRTEEVRGGTFPNILYGKSLWRHKNIDSLNILIPKISFCDSFLALLDNIKL